MSDRNHDDTHSGVETTDQQRKKTTDRQVDEFSASRVDETTAFQSDSGSEQPADDGWDGPVGRDDAGSQQASDRSIEPGSPSREHAAFVLLGVAATILVVARGIGII